MTAVFAVSLSVTGLTLAGPASALPPPANDDFASAITLTGTTGTLDSNNLGATAQAGEPAPIDPPGTSGNASVWYSWTAPATVPITFDTCATVGDPPMDTVLGVYTGTAVDALTTVGENDDSCGAGSSSVTFDAVSGHTYRILVGGWNEDQGFFTLSWGPPTADLSVVNTPSADIVMVGTHLTYGITVTNNGPDGATSVVLTNQLFDYRTTRVVSMTPSQGSCTVDGAYITCDLGTIQAMDSATVAIVVRPSRTDGEFTDWATVSTTATDHISENDSANSAVQVVPNGQGCTIVGTSAPDHIAGTAGNDVICGLGGNDTIRGGRGNDTIRGNNGNDTLIGARGNDTLNGGPGFDTVSYRTDPNSVTVDLANGTATDGTGGTDTLISVGGGGVYGSNAADQLIGSGSNNRLYGGPGDDTLSGRGGNDLLRGAAGNDTLNGGTGHDSCRGETETSCETN